FPVRYFIASLHSVVKNGVSIFCLINITFAVKFVFNSFISCIQVLRLLNEQSGLERILHLCDEW
ncbi:hypothetical protein, partial [Escherichia coli]|uniref:hypothetical protein n=1 Tax=Escherichia coli TaxID=562 RepID=UPI00215A102E